ncbi:unnamed protein product, partial [Amoebophrya sp. A120]
AARDPSFCQSLQPFRHGSGFIWGDRVTFVRDRFTPWRALALPWNRRAQKFKLWSYSLSLDVFETERKRNTLSR